MVGKVTNKGKVQKKTTYRMNREESFQANSYGKGKLKNVQLRYFNLTDDFVNQERMASIHKFVVNGVTLNFERFTSCPRNYMQSSLKDVYEVT